MELVDHLDGYEGETSAGGSGFAIGLLCGALIGAGIALLFAPKPGSELRHQVTETAAGFRRRASDAYDGAAHAIERVAERGRRAYQAGREAYQNTRTTATSPINTSVS